MVVKAAYPECQANQYKKNGHTHIGKQNHQCKTCGSQFVASPRFNNTLRQRLSCLVRDTLSFSKKLANHIGGRQRTV
jgi:transposase-like protein